MVTVTHLVEKLIEQKPFILEALSKGLINHAALAEELIPQVKLELKKDVTFAAVNMAIRRFSEKLAGTFVATAKFDPHTDITIKSHLIEITLYKEGDVQKYLKEVYSLVDLRKGDFLTITQGLHEVMIITNQRYEQKILALFSKHSIKKIIHNLNSLTI